MRFGDSGDKGGVSLPLALKTAMLTAGTLNAYIIVDDGTRQSMSINGNNAGINLTGLTQGPHTFVIEFEYIISTNSGTPVMLARVTRELNVGAGSNNLSVAETDYNTSFDDDNDGNSNLNELAVGSSPFAGYTVSSISGNTSENGNRVTFSIVLTYPPSGDVNIDISSSDTNEGNMDKTSLKFTTADWSEPQIVTVTGVDDSTIDGNISYSIQLSAFASTDINYNGEKPADVSVTNVDNDSSGFNISPINRSTTESAGSGSFTAQLNNRPTADVVMTLSSSITIPAGSATTGSVTINLTPDNIDEANETIEEHLRVCGAWLVKISQQ